jgi:microcompartment protein CcmL/EutN
MNLTVLGVLEINSIASGMKSLDEMVKKAPISIIEARTICPGKFLIIISGDVASVESSMLIGKEMAKDNLLDELFLPMIHEDVVNAIGKTVKIDEWDAIGMIETLSVASSIEAADVAAKAGGVRIIEVRLAIGFGGKSYIKIMGSHELVEIAMEEAVEKVRRKGFLCMDTIIPRPHPEMKSVFMQ